MVLKVTMFFLSSPSSTSWISESTPWIKLSSLSLSQNVSPTALHPEKLQRKAIQSFSGYQAVEHLFSNLQKIVELPFFFFFSFFSFQITQNWFGSMTSTLAWMKNKKWKLCLVWNQKRGLSCFSLSSIFIKTVFFPFSWMMYTFNIPGEKCQWYASHNKGKSKEMQLQGTGNFIIFSMKCPEENLILKITGTI